MEEKTKSADARKFSRKRAIALTTLGLVAAVGSFFGVRYLMKKAENKGYEEGRTDGFAEGVFEGAHAFHENEELLIATRDVVKEMNGMVEAGNVLGEDTVRQMVKESLDGDVDHEKYGIVRITPVFMQIRNF